MRITWVDMNASGANPSMQHLSVSAERFISEGFDIRLVCEKCLPALDDRVTVRLSPQKVPNFESLVFSLRSNWLFRRRPELRKTGGLIHSTGANVFGADLISMHFIPADWLPRLLRAGGKDWRDWTKVPIYALAAVLEWVQRRRSPHAHFHCVSRSLAHSLVKKGIAPERITVIPTPYNAEKFHVAARREHREAARAEMGFGAGDTVFSFISQGSYHRKGIAHAAETVGRLRAAGHPVHLLVIGGKGASWERMRAKLLKRHPDSGGWLHIAGFVPDLVHTLAASDAFLLPSLYEGFAAVEVEAAAMGLPLLLTAHEGVEMILREGVNGWLISSSPAAAAEKIAGLLGQIRPRDEADTGEAITLGVWQERYAELYRKLAPCRESA